MSMLAGGETNNQRTSHAKDEKVERQWQRTGSQSLPLSISRPQNYTAGAFHAPGDYRRFIDCDRSRSPLPTAILSQSRSFESDFLRRASCHKSLSSVRSSCFVISDTVRQAVVEQESFPRRLHGASQSTLSQRHLFKLWFSTTFISASVEEEAVRKL